MAFTLSRKLHRSRGTADRPQVLLANPILINDVRMRMRHRTSIAVIALYLACMCLTLTLYLVRHGSFGDGGNSNAGVQLFQALAIVQLFLILVVTPATTSGAISGERRGRTWELLLVSRLTGFQIVWGKIVAGLAFNAVLAIAPLPLYGAPLALGGVGLGDILHIYAVFLLTILLLSSMSLLVSTLTRRPSVSTVISAGISLVLGVGLSILAIVDEVQPQIAVLSDIGQLASPPSNPTPLGVLGQIDPLIALLSVLPSGGGGSALGDLGAIRHAFGLPLVMTWWVAFGVLAVALSAMLLALSSTLVRKRSVRIRRRVHHRKPV